MAMIAQPSDASFSEPVQMQIMQVLQTLSPEHLKSVLDFAEFLAQKTRSPEDFGGSELSALEAAGLVLGEVGDGPPDLSTNPKYMEGFGTT
jgi:hypothetical protein